MTRNLLLPGVLCSMLALGSGCGKNSSSGEDRGRAGSGAAMAAPADPNQPPRPLTQMGNKDARTLRDGGGDINAKDAMGTTQLMDAALSDQADVVRRLLSNNADVNATDETLGQTALHFCAVGDSAGAAAALIEKGARVNATDRRGKTALHEAASSAAVNVMKLLLANGASVNARDGAGKPPLHRAAQAAQPEAVALLLEAGAERAARDNRAHSPLDDAEISGNETTRELLRTPGGAADPPSARITIGRGATEGASVGATSAKANGVPAIDAAAGKSRAFVGLKATSAGTKAAVAAGVESPLGAAVLSLTPHGPAAQAGLLRGDLIVQLGASQIDCLEDLESAVRRSEIGSEQRVIAVRGVNRREVALVVGAQPVTYSLLFFTHATGGYRLKLLEGWQAQPIDQREKTPDMQFDALESSERNYRLSCFKSSWPAPEGSAAIKEWAARRLVEHPEAQIAYFQLAGAPAVRVGCHVPNERRTLWRISWVHGGRRYVINAVGPPLADPSKLPPPVSDMLATLELLPGESPEPAGIAVEGSSVSTPEQGGTGGAKVNKPHTADSGGHAPAIARVLTPEDLHPAVLAMPSLAVRTDDSPQKNPLFKPTGKITCTERRSMRGGHEMFRFAVEVHSRPTAAAALETGEMRVEVVVDQAGQVLSARAAGYVDPDMLEILRQEQAHPGRQ